MGRRQNRVHETGGVYVSTGVPSAPSVNAEQQLERKRPTQGNNMLMHASSAPRNVNARQHPERKRPPQNNVMQMDVLPAHGGPNAKQPEKRTFPGNVVVMDVPPAPRGAQAERQLNNKKRPPQNDAIRMDRPPVPEIINTKQQLEKPTFPNNTTTMDAPPMPKKHYPQSSAVRVDVPPAPQPEKPAFPLMTMDAPRDAYVEHQPKKKRYPQNNTMRMDVPPVPVSFYPPYFIGFDTVQGNVNPKQQPAKRTFPNDTMTIDAPSIPGNTYAEQRTKNYHPQNDVIRMDASLAPVRAKKLKKRVFPNDDHHEIVQMDTPPAFNDFYAKPPHEKNSSPLDINGAHGHQLPSLGTVSVTETPLPPDITIRQAGRWTRFRLFLCCISTESGNDYH